MNKRELKEALDKEGIHPSYYSLNGLIGGPWDGVRILDKQGKKWVTYYFERGAKWDIKVFESEDEACNYFFQWISNDPITRIYNESKK